MKHFQLEIFFLLTFLLTWAMWFPAALTKLHGGTSAFGPDSVGQFGRWAPGIAAIIVIAVVEKKGIASLFRPLRLWRVNIGWYLFALFFQPVLFYASKLIDSLFGKTYQVVSPLASLDIEAPLVFIAIGVIISAIPGAFMEELGWRGFALRRLQVRNNALIASIILGLIWGIWHIPSMMYFGETNSLKLIRAVVNFIPVTILFTWLFNNTKGSLLLVTLYHAAIQYSNNFLGDIPTQTANYLTWLVAVVVLVTTTANNLSKSNERIRMEAAA